jgi:uncharacterized protein (DUF849 family)
MGGHVRVGLEDNLWLDGNRTPARNAQLIERLVGIARGAGRGAASPAEARAIIGLETPGIHREDPKSPRVMGIGK